jgi:hypothetical protein
MRRSVQYQVSSSTSPKATLLLLPLSSSLPEVPVP